MNVVFHFSLLSLKIVSFTNLLNLSWLISACAAVVKQPDYFNKVIPNDQSFDESGYAGIFHFRIWQFGQWYAILNYNKMKVLPSILISFDFFNF